MSTLSPPKQQDWHTLKALIPYLFAYKWRLFIAMALLIAAKFANVSVPIFLKDIVDQLSITHTPLIVPVALVISYGLARFLNSLFGELRDAVFAQVLQGAIRQVAVKVFTHLYQLSLRFHLARQTGGMSRDIERGTRGIGLLLNFTVFNILPTLLEIALVIGILLSNYHWHFAAITFITIALYISFTLSVTEWRLRYRRTMNELDSRANSRAIDALINFETVKYFGNERWEIQRYQESLMEWERSAVKNQVSLNLLNSGQSAIIALGVTLLMWLAADGVAQGQMSVGDLVLVNAYLLQLYMPLNFLGFVYREIKHALADMERMFALLSVHREIQDSPDARPLDTQNAEICFKNVQFGYESDRKILKGITFTLPAGQTLAVVGQSGAGKSTLSRLLFRFYDVDDGCISIDGHDIRQLTQHSLREHIGIVPQDTVLFNDTILYNIAYGRPNASHEDIIRAAKAAQIHDFISALPQGYATQVGERGLKLSGGEKQRIAIARTLLKNPPILIFDEATSALDTRTEKSIQIQLAALSAQRTTLIIAHRLSTITHADQIIVMAHGEIVEHGTHQSLLAQNGTYAHLWQLQQEHHENHNT